MFNLASRAMGALLPAPLPLCWDLTGALPLSPCGALAAAGVAEAEGTATGSALAIGVALGVGGAGTLGAGLGMGLLAGF